MLLAVAQVHAQEHLRPILRLGAAGAGMDRHDRVAPVVRPGELQLEIERLEVRLEAVEESDGVAVDLAFGLADQLVPGLELGLVARQLFQRVEAALDRPPLLQDGLAFIGVVPEIRSLHFAVELGELLFIAGGVKETPKVLDLLGQPLETLGELKIIDLGHGAGFS